MLNISHTKNTPNKKNGFTLIEIMVSLSIFSIVMVIALGTLLVLIKASAISQSAQSITNNLSFALDGISRNLRTGYFFYCQDIGPGVVDDGNAFPGGTSGTRDCATGANGVIFTDGGSGDRYGYRFNATNNTIEHKIDIDGGSNGNWFSLTSNEVVVSTFAFYVTGADGVGAGDLSQPSIRMLIRGEAGDPGLLSFFDIQTTVVSRGADF